jgi:NMD protein affecting ribosome stability and mRNA decay
MCVLRVKSAIQRTGGINMDSKCVQCGKENDLMVAFTKYKVCGKCVKKNYKKAVGNKKGGK